MLSRTIRLCALLALAAPQTCWCAAKVHTVALGSVRHEPYSVAGDPAGAQKEEKFLNVRPLVVDGKVKEWLTGEVHDVTERSFAVRRALRLNDSLPGDHGAKWVWQRGPWVLVDRGSGKVTALHLPDFDPAVSAIVWFRDYAAYCGVNTSGKQVYAVVAQVAARRPLLAKKMQPWDPANHETPVCAPALWQRDPLRVTFQANGADPVSVDLVGTSAVLVEEGDSDNE